MSGSKYGPDRQTTAPKGRHRIAQDVSPGSGEKTIAGTAWSRGLFITQRWRKRWNLQKDASVCGETTSKVSLVTDNRKPNLRYKECSGWHIDCTINLGSGRSEEQGRQIDPERSPRAQGKGPYV
jgi:hypothetical protein